MKLLQVVKSTVGTFDRVDRTVSLINRNGHIQLRWSVAGERYHLSIAGGITKSSIKAAYSVAHTIASDIPLNKFDPTLIAYDPNRKKRQELVRQRLEPTIKDLWERYKSFRKNTTAPTTQKSVWVEIDRGLNALPSDALKLKNIEYLGEEYMKIFSVSTCHRHFESLQPAIRKAIPDLKLKQQLPKKSTKPIEWFPPDEVKQILLAFESDRFCPDAARVLHSHYFPYVSFLAHTGCRPEEAIPLTWEDFVLLPNGSGCEVSIVKTWSKNLLKPYTKNYLNRTIALSPKLQAILEPKRKPSGLIFPSPRGNYINQSNFCGKVWRTILLQLVDRGKVKKYLCPYCLRHSFVTNLLHEHDIALPTIAQLVGDRVETIMKFYAGAKKLETQTFPILY
ncbi:site-specific integrase [Roseofilum casamattae]|uniref:Tyrosine-type recombinase/integrase n=1 Tax=Roseofilum casamattae BLCC-M143 TaxID=3022442 RepID=A0ABT7BYK9_9CYAN|nr:tyrosine-type recombinase/integrase [Roseofilum casamattae]MDJ1184292.1 tyrosine-type recombinase/integrase [Roseofilum casamattae BLCC-M143]